MSGKPIGWVRYWGGGGGKGRRRGVSQPIPANVIAAAIITTVCLFIAHCSFADHQHFPISFRNIIALLGMKSNNITTVIN
jgi:hypothetical protein